MSIPRATSEHLPAADGKGLGSSADAVEAPPVTDAPVGAAPRRRGLLAQVLREPKALLGLGIIGFFVLLSVFAPLVAPYSPSTQTCAVYAAPSRSHWLGCDDGGIDMLTQLIYGGRVSLVVGFAAALVALVIGGLVGIFAGYLGGWLDAVLMRVTDYLLVVPDLVLMIVVAAVWGPSLFHLIIVIGALGWTSNARLIRSQVISLRQRVYVKRARSVGASDLRIVGRHILPHVTPILTATTVLTIANAIYAESALAFLGLSDPDVTTWGTILEHAFERTAISSGAWWAIVPDGLCLAAVVLGCFLFGQVVEDSLNPRLAVSHLSPRTWRRGRPVVARKNGAR